MKTSPAASNPRTNVIMPFVDDVTVFVVMFLFSRVAGCMILVNQIDVVYRKIDCAIELRWSYSRRSQTKTPPSAGEL
jgi:hypothetical protein